MKKFWKIKNDADIKKSLESLSLSKEYIDILLDYSDFTRYLDRSKYVYITYCDDKKRVEGSYFDGFGWSECEYHDWLIVKGYSYIGEINLRQQKLLKWKT